MTLNDLWMEAHVALASDGYVTLMGNDRDPSAIRDTMLQFPGYFFLIPTHEEIKKYLIDNDREDEIEYLMEEY